MSVAHIVGTTSPFSHRDVGYQMRFWKMGAWEHAKFMGNSKKREEGDFSGGG